MQKHASCPAVIDEERVWRFDKRGGSKTTRAPQRGVREALCRSPMPPLTGGSREIRAKPLSVSRAHSVAVGNASARLQNDLAGDLIARRPRADDAVSRRGEHGHVIEVGSPARLADD